MLAQASSNVAVIRVKPGARATSSPAALIVAAAELSDFHSTERPMGSPRLSRTTASRRISSPAPTATSNGAIAISSALGDATSTRSTASTPLHVAVRSMEPAPTATASPPPPAKRSTPASSPVHVTALEGRQMPFRPRTVATSTKRSPTSSRAGGGRMEMSLTVRSVVSSSADDGPCDGGRPSAAVSDGVSAPTTATRRPSSERSGSSSARGIAPNAATASAMRGHRSAGSFASMRRTAASRSGGQAAARS